MRTRYKILSVFGVVLLSYLIYSNVRPFFEAAAAEERQERHRQKTLVTQSLQDRLDKKVEAKVRLLALSVIHALERGDSLSLENYLLPEKDHLSRGLGTPSDLSDHDLYKQISAYKRHHGSYKENILEDLNLLTMWIKESGGISSIELSLDKPIPRGQVPHTYFKLDDRTLNRINDPDDVPGYYDGWIMVKYRVRITSKKGSVRRMKLTFRRNKDTWVLYQLWT